jgi:hypothetical protein
MIIHVLRKPVVGTVAQNALTHGTGALNIDGCRITTSDKLNGGAYAQKGSERNDGWRMKRDQLAGTFNQPTGRWPANLVLNHLPDCIASGSKTVKANGHAYGPANRNKGGISTTGHSGQTGLVESVNREENVPASQSACQAQCPVERLDKQSGLLTSNTRQPTYKPIMNSTGGASMNWNQNNLMDTTERGFKDAGGASRFFQHVKVIPD